MELGRNEHCHCGSKKKYKKCCLQDDQEKRSRTLAGQNVEIATSRASEIGNTLDSLGLNFDPAENSQSFMALERWVDDYLATIDDSHPFVPALKNPNLTHKDLIDLAESNGWTDYSETARELYKAWQASA